jgi:hypothetical protein
VTGVTVSSWQAVRATYAEEEAQQQRNAAEAQRDRALNAEAHAKKENEAGLAVLQFFQERVLAAARPKDQQGGLGTDATIRAALDAAEPTVAVTFQNRPSIEASLRSVLGQTYFRMGEWERAAQQFARAADRSRVAWGPDDDFAAQMTGFLAEAYVASGDVEKAVPLIEQALPILRAKLGSDDPSTIEMIGNLARAYRTIGKLDLALPLFEEMFQRLKAKLGPEHHDTLAGMDYLAGTYAAARKYTEAIPLSQDLITLQRRRLPADDPALARNLALLGLYLLQAERPAEAEALLREGLAIREKKEPDVWTTFNTKSLLGAALLGQKKYADAEPLLLAGYEGMKQRQDKIPANSKVRLPEAIERLVRLYEALDKKDDAAKWRKELEASKAAQKQPEKQP